MFHAKKAFKFVLIYTLLITLPFSAVFAGAAGQTVKSGTTTAAQPAAGAAQSDNTAQIAYADYLTAHQNDAMPQKELLIKAKELSASASPSGSAGKYDASLGESGAIEYDEDSVKVTYSVNVETAGLYEIGLEYMPLDEVIRAIELDVQINGQLPFKQAEGIKIPKRYVNSQKITQDNRGNDMRPSTVVEKSWVYQTFTDAGGTIGAYEFPFHQGRNEITLTFQTGHVAIGSLKIFNEATLPSYQSYLQSHTGMASGFSDVIEGESASYRSDAVICLNYDRSGPEVTPYDPRALKLNTIGGSGWSDPGQYVGWTVNVPADGYYRLQIRYRQDTARGRSVYRRLYVNGEVPFAQAAAFSFPYGNGWQTMYLGGKTPDLFYLKKGQNDIRLESVCGDFTTAVKKADELSSLLRSVYSDIVMITGSNADANRDYMLTTEIPDLTTRFKTLIKKLNAMETEMEKLDGGNLSDDAAIIRTLRVQLQGFLENPDSIAVRMSRFQTNISSFSDFASGLKEQPLEIDRIGIGTPNMPSLIKEPSFLQGVTYGVQSFFSTFVTDYASIGSVDNNVKSIDVWVNYTPGTASSTSVGTVGRDQAQSIMQVTDSLFTPKKHIGVNIRLVQEALAPAILSGVGPDVAMYVNSTEPIVLAARGGLVNVGNMKGFSDLQKQFRTGSFIPYEFNGGTYAVPFTQNFPVLFCRDDILKKLGVTPPKTWSEFYDALAVIQKNNMTVGVPNMTTDAMTTDNTIFAMFLYQNGGTYFNADKSKTNFDDELSVNAFKQWTDLYKNYGLPVQYNFYQRFRLGDMPMAIEGYPMYNMLTVAAPEITGLWSIHSLPGVENSDGSVTNTAISSGVCSVILKSSKKAESAWEFVKWVSGVEAQTQISLSLESVLGPTGRLATANLEAFDNLPWDKSAAGTIKEQWKSLAFLPMLPENYYVERNLTNAFRKTVYYKQNYREALLEYNREINMEITRRSREFGLKTAD